MFITCVIAARVIGWTWAGERLTRRDDWTTLARVPHSPSISAAGSRACTMVEAMGLTWEIITARPGNFYKQV